MAVPDHGEWVQTHGGLPFDLLSPRPEQVRPGDVAHHLSLINRFTGALSRPYSVAQHSLLVVELLRHAGYTDPQTLLQGAVHDAAEAYVGDVSAPLKRLLPDYRKVEKRVWQACAQKFGVPAELDPAVKEADWLACRLEAWEYGQRPPVGGWAEGDPRPGMGMAVMTTLTQQDDWWLWRNRWLDTVQRLQERL